MAEVNVDREVNRIYLASLKKDDAGESNWYLVLGVDPSATDDTILEKSYHLMSSITKMLKHRKSAEALEAFHLVKKAWKVLEEPKSRLAFDVRAGLNKVPEPGFGCERLEPEEESEADIRRRKRRKRLRPGENLRYPGTNANTGSNWSPLVCSLEVISSD